MANHAITGKTALIAGGAKNLGGLLAVDLAKAGAKTVVIHYNSAASSADADRTAAAPATRIIRELKNHFRGFYETFYPRLLNASQESNP